MPMVSPRLPLAAVHALLHHRPATVGGHEKSVQVEIETVLDRGAIHHGHQPAGSGQGAGVQAGAIAQRQKLIGGASTVLATAAADVDAKFALERRQTTLK